MGTQGLQCLCLVIVPDICGEPQGKKYQPDLFSSVSSDVCNRYIYANAWMHLDL